MIAHLPSVIAIPLAEYFREAHPVLRLHRLCDAVEVLTKFLTVVALGEVRRQLQGSPLPEDLLKVLQPQIQRPTFGQWLAMLLALTEAVAWDKAVCGPAFPRFIKENLEPGMWGPEGLVRFRNDLVHGGGTPQAWARRELERWEPWLVELVPHLDFLEEVQVCYLSQGTARRLMGPSLAGEEISLSPTLAQKLQHLDEHVVLLRGDAWLDLWPLCDYGRATLTTLEGPREAGTETPLVFFRADRKRCFYAALGSDLPHGERADVLEEFLALFRLREYRPTARQALDFEEELRQDAASLIGRDQEVKHARDVLRQAQKGVFWLSGPGGIGKSFLMAKLAEDLRLPASQGCRIAWRFKLSDEARGNRTAFLRHVFTKLAKWRNQEEQTPAADPAKLFDQVRELLDEVGKLTPEKSGGRASRVLIFVDGLDEIARLDESFLELPFLLSRENVIWICAGRPEGRLPQVFEPARATHLFPEGLPAMTDAGIRALLLESTLSRKYDLLTLDTEADGEVKNAALAAVVARAQGLPLYVHYVIQDIDSGHYRFADLPHRLPPSLSDYYDDLLRRLSIGDLQALLTPLVVTLAWAHAPLDEDLLHYFMVRRRVLTEGKKSRELLRQGLETIASMVRLAPLPGAEGFGYEPYHPTFREHLRSDQAGNLELQNCLAREEFAALARGWAEPSPEHPARLYALTYGPKILIESERWDDLEGLLTDPRFLDAKLTALGTYALVTDYELALASSPGLDGEKNKALQLLEGAIRLSAHVVESDPTQLSSQLTGRLLDFEEKEIQAFLKRLRESQNRPWLRLLSPSLIAPGGPLLRTLAGHSKGVSGVAVSPDGRRAVSASDDKTLKVWDLDTGVELRTLTGHTGSVNAVAVTPDGRRAVSASEDKILKVWDLDTGVELHTLTGHTDPVKAVAVTPDGRWAVSGSRDMTLKVWDLETGVELRTLAGHTNSVFAVAVTPDGRRAVSAGSWDRTLKVWDLDTGVELHTLAGHTDVVYAVAVTPDGRWAVSGSWDRTLKIWDLETGVDLCTLTGHTSFVKAVAVTPDGRWAVSASVDKTLKVWDLDTGAELCTLTGHTNSVYAVVVTPDGRRAVSGSWDMTLKVWDLDTGAELCTLTCHTNWVTAVAVTPDGRWAVSASYDKTLKVWDLDTGAELCTLTGHTGSVNAVAVTPDGRRAVSASDKTLKVWDLDTGAEICTLTGHTHWVDAVAVTPDGRRAVSGSRDMTLKVWDLDTGVELHTLTGHTDAVKAVAVTPDGRRAVSGSWDRTLKVWDLDTGAELCTLTGHTNSVDAVAVTPDGRRAVSGSRDMTLKVWDLDTGVELHTLTGHYDYVMAVAVTPDGRRAVSGSWDRTLKIWDLETGAALATFQGDAPLYACAPAPDGVTLVAGGGLGRVHFLRLEGVTPGPSYVTACRWQSSLALGCLHCRHWSEIPESALETELPCPKCGKLLKINPFTIDADWRPIARAW